jgi:hypothetical protein
VKGDKGRQPGGATLCLLLGSVDLDRFVFTKSESERARVPVRRECGDLRERDERRM